MPNLLWILLIIVLVMSVAGLPTWPYASSWNYGYYPSGIGLVLVIILLVLLFYRRV